MTRLIRRPLFNPDGDTDVRLRRMIGGNTTNLNDFNNMKYAWVSDWYRQAMNNFWIPEEINLSQDVKDYPRLLPAERSAYDKILSFLVFLDSIQTANLPNIGAYITANEVNLCLSIQAFQECVHSQSYSYMLDTICSPVERNDILYQWKTDEHLLRRNTFIGDCYNEFQERTDAPTLLRVMMANYILEGIYFYSGFMFFYNLSRRRRGKASCRQPAADRKSVSSRFPSPCAAKGRTNQKCQEPEAEVPDFTDPDEALAAVRAGAFRPQIAFLDIQMRGWTGLDLALEL